MDGESASDLFFLSALGVKMGREVSAGFQSPGVRCEPAPVRVQRSLRQMSSIWSQSACFYQLPVQQPVSVIMEFCPPPSGKLFPISSPTLGSGYSPTFVSRWMFILPLPSSWPVSEKASILSP